VRFLENEGAPSISSEDRSPKEEGALDFGQVDRLDQERTMQELARTILRSRKRRSDEFSATIFGEPAWEMLLELFVQESAGASTTTVLLHAGTKMPQSAVERWIRHLENCDLLVRRSHPVDPETEFVELTDDARQALERYLLALRDS
jgi:DNA-binding MarR family transcriptional regulator